ncbi:MAG: pyridoxal phosphate-dependent aminotransferase [Deltaproteobacteria bacterium]|nr:pyridoxal phosphate-dependent aminotransferase [Deltaproteobacteria bacterium]
MFKYATRVGCLRPSPSNEISNLAIELKAQGRDVISLATGEPDFDTPEPIRQAAEQAIHSGVTRYTPTAGFLSLRQAIAQKYSVEYQTSIHPDEIIITCGAKHAISLALQCLVEPGESVLLPTPAWTNFGPMIELAGASILPLPLFEEDGFKPNLDRLKRMAVPAGVKGIILNSPNNPTGAVLSRDDLVRIVCWALQRDLWIISDEVYDKILFEEIEHTPIASLGPEVRAHTIVANGLSKTYAMSGWRIGWAIADGAFIQKMVAMQSQTTQNAPSFAQSAAIAAIRLASSFVDEMVDIYDSRRQYCMRRLNTLHSHLSYVEPKGAFYFFINLGKWLSEREMTDTEFCRQLLLQQGIALVPGTAFGKERYVRLSYATSSENLANAFNRLDKFLNAPENQKDCPRSI